MIWAMDEAEQNAYFKQRFLEFTPALVREAMEVLGLDTADEHTRLILVDLCLRTYNAGVRDGGAEVVAQAVEQEAEFGFTLKFTMGVTIPEGPLGSS